MFTAPENHRSVQRSSGRILPAVSMSSPALHPFLSSTQSVSGYYD